MLISTVFQRQSVNTIKSYNTTLKRIVLPYSPDFEITLFSRCVVSALSFAKNLLVDSVIQTKFYLPWFPSKSFSSNFHQNPGKYQDLDFLQCENISTKIISRFKTIIVSWEVQERFEKGAFIIPEVRSVVPHRSAVENSEMRSRNFRSAQMILKKCTLIFYFRKAQW